MSVPFTILHGYAPSLSVPPLSICSFWSGIKSITLFFDVSSNSPEFASAKPHTFLAYSITAICIPRQIPRYGTSFSLAYFAAAILPSIPLLPKPPGTISPSQAESISAAFFSVTVSLSIHFISTYVP